MPRSENVPHEDFRKDLGSRLSKSEGANICLESSNEIIATTYRDSFSYA
jgi:hypothetical protein